MLKKENYVTVSDISYKGVSLLKGENNHLINQFYAIELINLELFYYDNKLFFFEYLEADETADIDYESYMFIGFTMGLTENTKFCKETMNILEKLERCLND